MYVNSTVTIEGNLADDVAIKENQSGGVYADFVILVNQGTDRAGGDRPATRWAVRVSGRTAENLYQSQVGKGTRVLVVGSVVTDSWHDRDTGDKRYAQRVIAQAVAVSLTFATVGQVQRTSGRHADSDAEQPTEQAGEEA